MNTTLDVDIIEINDEQAHAAKLLASALSDAQIRKRGMLDMLGIACAISYLHAKKIRIDTKKSVYKIPLLFEEFKITDIYHGNYRIDVITLYKEKTIKIPKIHVDMDILPHFYFIVQIGAKIKEAKMIGFIDASKIAACSHDSKYYYPPLDMLMDLGKFTTKTRHSIATKTLIGKHVDCLGLFLKFIDNDLSSIYKRQLIQHLMNCDSCRARFIDTMEFEKLANNIKFYPDLIRKNEEKTHTPPIGAIINNNGYASFEEGLDKVKIRQSDISEELQEDFSDINSQDCENLESEKTVQMFDITNKNEKKLISKKVIDAIFDEIPKIEMSQIKNIASAKNRRILFIAMIILFIIGSFALISFKGSGDIIEQNNDIANYEDPFEYEEDFDFNETEAKLISTKNPQEDNYIIRHSIPSNPTYSPTITKISWEAPESLVKKENYTKFLQLIGKNVKLNLQNDLLLVSDIPTNKIAKIDIRIASNGDVDNIKIVTSSGSVAIDASIKKVITDTLTYMKPPSHGIISRPVDVTLTLELQ